MAQARLGKYMVVSWVDGPEVLYHQASVCQSNGRSHCKGGGSGIELDQQPKEPVSQIRIL